MTRDEIRCPGCAETRLIDCVDTQRQIYVCMVCSRQWQVKP